MSAKFLHPSAYYVRDWLKNWINAILNVKKAKDAQYFKKITHYKFYNKNAICEVKKHISRLFAYHNISPLGLTSFQNFRDYKS